MEAAPTTASAHSARTQSTWPHRETRITGCFSAPENKKDHLLAPAKSTGIFFWVTEPEYIFQRSGKCTRCWKVSEMLVPT